MRVTAAPGLASSKASAASVKASFSDAAPNTVTVPVTWGRAAVVVVAADPLSESEPQPASSPRAATSATTTSAARRRTGGRVGTGRVGVEVSAMGQDSSQQVTR